MNGSRQRVTPPPPLGAFADGEQTAAAEAHERETLPAPAHSEREVAAAFEAAREDPREDPTPLFVRAICPSGW